MCGMHDWTFTAASMSGAPQQVGSDVAVAIAVCRQCGLIRSEVAGPRREMRINLAGDCPEAPAKAAPRVG